MAHCQITLSVPWPCAKVPWAESSPLPPSRSGEQSKRVEYPLPALKNSSFSPASLKSEFQPGERGCLLSNGNYMSVGFFIVVTVDHVNEMSWEIQGQTLGSEHWQFDRDGNTAKIQRLYANQFRFWKQNCLPFWAIHTPFCMPTHEHAGITFFLGIKPTNHSAKLAQTGQKIRPRKGWSG